MGRLLNVATVEAPVAPPAPSPEAESAQAQRKADNYGAAIVKMLPAEAVTTFVFVNELIRSSVPNEDGIPRGYGLLCLAAIALIAIGNVFFLRSTFRPGRDHVQDLVWTGLATTIAFLLWTWLIGGVWWSVIGWTDPVYPQVLVAVFTFLAPAIPFVKKDGVTVASAPPKTGADGAERTIADDVAAGSEESPEPQPPMEHIAEGEPAIDEKLPARG